MKKLPEIFRQNRSWAQAMLERDPRFFEGLSNQQKPRYLWIGCADSRVPATEICGLQPGEMFVHRNVANLVVHTDFSCLSVLQYAVEVLRVTDIIVCGHYGCGGVRAALDTKSYGLIDNWLRNIKDLRAIHKKELEVTGDDAEAQFDKLCEINVAAQVANVCYTTIVQDAWARGQMLAVHGWIYGLTDGLLKDLDLCVTSADQLPEAYKMG